MNAKTHSHGWKPGTVFLRITPHGSKPYVLEATCWNTDLYLDARSEEQIALGGTLQVSTREEYRQERVR